MRGRIYFDTRFEKAQLIRARKVWLWGLEVTDHVMSAGNEQREKNAGAPLASFLPPFYFVWDPSPVEWDLPYSRQVFLQLNFSENSLKDILGDASLW